MLHNNCLRMAEIAKYVCKSAELEKIFKKNWHPIKNNNNDNKTLIYRGMSEVCKLIKIQTVWFIQTNVMLCWSCSVTVEM